MRRGAKGELDAVPPGADARRPSSRCADDSDRTGEPVCPRTEC